MKSLVIAADHRGFHQKKIVTDFFDEHSITYTDVGTETQERVDYPLYAQKALACLRSGTHACAILLCGSGAGMAIVANRMPGIYAAVVWNCRVAAMVKEDDNCNVLVIPSDFVADDQVLALVQAWMQASFKGGRYAERLAMIDAKKGS